MDDEEDFEEYDLDSGPDSSEIPCEDQDLINILADLEPPAPLNESLISGRDLEYKDYQTYTPRYFEPVGLQGGSYQELDDARTKSMITDWSARLYSIDPLTLRRLSRKGNFPGCGIYALYYNGSSETYIRIRSDGSHMPIYIGKSLVLARRLQEHVSTLENSDLSINDFTCKLIVLPSQWILHAEENLIQRYKPVWNALRGFGSGERERGWNVRKSRTTDWAAFHSYDENAQKVRATKPERIARIASKLEDFVLLSRSRYENERVRITPFVSLCPTTSCSTTISLPCPM